MAETHIRLLSAPHVSSHQSLHGDKTSEIFLSEIIVGAVSSSILTDEPFGWRQITGCSLIVIGGVVAVVLSPKEDVSK